MVMICLHACIHNCIQLAPMKPNLQACKNSGIDRMANARGVNTLSRIQLSTCVALLLRLQWIISFHEAQPAATLDRGCWHIVYATTSVVTWTLSRREHVKRSRPLFTRGYFAKNLQSLSHICHLCKIHNRRFLHNALFKRQSLINQQ